jgi:hypothetical protein
VRRNPKPPRKVLLGGLMDAIQKSRRAAISS